MTKQPLHIVLGGELVDPSSNEFRDISKIDYAGSYYSYEEAFAVWRGKAQSSVDNALMRYFIISFLSVI